MPLPMLPTADTAGSSTGSVLDTFIHDDLPTFALCSATMAAIWLACAAVTFAGAFTGAVVVAGPDSPDAARARRRAAAGVVLERLAARAPREGA